MPPMQWSPLADPFEKSVTLHAHSLRAQLKTQWRKVNVFMHQTPWHLLTEVLRGPFKNAQKGEIMWAMWLFIFSGRHLKTHSEEKLITLILNSKTQKQNILPCVSTCVKMAAELLHKQRQDSKNLWRHSRK